MMSEWLDRVHGTTGGGRGPSGGLASPVRMRRRTVDPGWKEEEVREIVIAEGDVVVHALFGEGTVLGIRARVATVAFSGGEKTVRTSFLTTR